MSEDCLTLNIWEPAGAHNAPVLFWIHGGALLTGVGGDPMYDGARIAFARTGHPTAPNEPDWPAYAPTNAYMDITDAPHPSTNLFPGMYDLDE